MTKVKMELAGYTMAQEEFKKKLVGVLSGVSREDFVKAFVRWYERCKKSIRINGSYTKKS